YRRAWLPAVANYETARSRVSTQSARFDIMVSEHDQAGSRLRRRSGESNTASRLAHGRGRTVPAGRDRLCPARPRVPAVLLDADRRGRLPRWRHRRAEPAGDALRGEARASEAAVHLHAVRRAPV